MVDDQYGRLTFTGELARAIRHLLEVGAPYGTYNVSNGGRPDDLGRHRPRRCSPPAAPTRPTVTGVTTAAYAEGKALAPRPQHSVLGLDKITATGFRPPRPAGCRHCAALI